MKKVYIAHPYRGKNGTLEEIERNLKNIDIICRNLSDDESNSETLLLSPLHTLSFYNHTDDQNMVLRKCKQLMTICDELWVFGDWKYSEGCKEEITVATKLNIPIIYFDNFEIKGW